MTPRSDWSRSCWFLLGKALIPAIMKNYQTEDDLIQVPAALQPFLPAGGDFPRSPKGAASMTARASRQAHGARGEES